MNMPTHAPAMNLQDWLGRTEVVEDIATATSANFDRLFKDITHD